MRTNARSASTEARARISPISCDGKPTATASRPPVLPAKSNADAFQDGWYCEIKNYNFDKPQFSGGGTTECRPPVNGHFTQVVWKDTTQLGCGKATCTIKDSKGKDRKATHWVCRYLPAGNVNVQDPNVLKAQVQRPCK